MRQELEPDEIDQRLAELKSEARELNLVLRRRYSGIIGQMVRRAAGGTALSQDSIQRFGGGVFLQFPPQIGTLEDSRRFSVVLWKLVDARLNAQFGSSGAAAAAPLKPKFMLRQFIDDLPDGEARGVLRSLAYIADDDPSDEAAIEARALLQDAYHQLHQVLWRNRKNLALRTDATISVTRKQPHPADLANYAQWFFLN
ncbi:MAG TPA: hypothetical protein VJ901_17820 [Thermoanaerobaculia bacterium]|nr:hypothetical protein [Thermoanaerobaculia bacterium]